MKKFNFETFLQQMGYEKNVVKNEKGGVYATTFQKEVEPMNWNSITIHSNRKLTACPPTGVLTHIDAEIPKSKREAEIILKAIEKI
ncbi:hypothetical protein PG587_09060 [Riemerella anatipestifer]|uniref:hypothetical protein n=1 Tax=Riemerella anatipestifer TaxID=34085 RepID=UPI0012B34799|nr:hypothetical protein [Riemerella anatipestifer]MDY3507012.1 hypothetical protein [Riemerella anatipestifer]MSN81975.1 hypothetical protein [Riemerella anatipestifer]QYR02307.1 hypothetical protein J6M00_08955 [Riemerella anatipestifer]UXN81026.1 hypothetical protein [Phage vB_RanS_PJN03]